MCAVEVQALLQAAQMRVLLVLLLAGADAPIMGCRIFHLPRPSGCGSHSGPVTTNTPSDTCRSKSGSRVQQQHAVMTRMHAFRRAGSANNRERTRRCMHRQCLRTHTQPCK